jgi:hypothetical protein
MLTSQKQIGFQSLRPANTQEATSLNGGIDHDSFSARGDRCSFAPLRRIFRLPRWTATESPERNAGLCARQLLNLSSYSVIRCRNCSG